MITNMSEVTNLSDCDLTGALEAISTSIMILVKRVISTSILKPNNPKGPNMAELYASIPIENDCP